MENNNSKMNSSKDIVTAITNAQSVVSQVNHFQARGYSEFEAWGIVFNLSMKDKEEKKFKDYVEYVSDLTNGFETPHTVAYENTTNYEIMWEWEKFVDEHYTGNHKSELYDFYFDYDDNSNIINSKQIVSDWLEEFAADMRVKIEIVTVSFGRKFLYVTGYNY